MTKEELLKLSRENLKKSKQGSLCECYDEAFIKGYELSEKRIEELEEKISNLLSCKNCPENKGGFICVKEYENKCLAQKIQYIKELQEENAELKELIKNIIRVTWGEGWNYSLDWKVKAEQFLNSDIKEG